MPFWPVPHILLKFRDRERAGRPGLPPTVASPNLYLCDMHAERCMRAPRAFLCTPVPPCECSASHTQSSMSELSPRLQHAPVGLPQVVEDPESGASSRLESPCTDLDGLPSASSSGRRLPSPFESDPPPPLKAPSSGGSSPSLGGGRSKDEQPDTPHMPHLTIRKPKHTAGLLDGAWDGRGRRQAGRQASRQAGRRASRTQQGRGSRQRHSLVTLHPWACLPQGMPRARASCCTAPPCATS